MAAHSGGVTVRAGSLDKPVLCPGVVWIPQAPPTARPSARLQPVPGPALSPRPGWEAEGEESGVISLQRVRVIQGLVCGCWDPEGANPRPLTIVFH